ncbi:glycosyltransferase family 1 protein [Pedobacter yulinensis]|uniref:Glycosyltransferase family 1 protein n=1 Tax=Pedobacter yulinensis TaxID=2126353 RepID=A0A2T3HNQ3_9SPHI|nr:glycosyltransferase family 1 protein [Pedobacter yulinensis]
MNSPRRNHKIIRTSTVALSLNVLLKGQLAFLNSVFEVIAVSGEGSDLQEVQEREKVAVREVTMSRTISVFKDLHSLWKLYRLFRKEKPVIIHSITPKAGLLTMLAGKLAGVPIRIHTFTGLIFPSKTGALQKLLISMDRLLCWAATNIYPEGNGVKNDLLKYKITKKQLKVIGNGNVNGIDTAYFDPSSISKETRNALRLKLGISANDFVFIFVGRIVADKGINELIAAFKSFDATYPCKLLLVGNFEQELDPVLPAVAEEIKENENIIHVGYQPNVRDFYAISDAFVFPSYREGFPNVVLQAGAMSLPSLVTDINGSNEIIIPGENGIIIPPKDVQALQNAMIEILRDKALYSRLQRHARLMISSRYEQPFVWNELVKEYNLLLSKKI